MTAVPGTNVALTIAPRTVGLMRPVVTPAAMIEAHKEITALISQGLEAGKDYGVIPGAGDKPTLLKPGAERLAAAFGTLPRYTIVSQDIEHDRPVPWSKRKKVWRNQYKGDKSFDWQQENGESLGLYRYVIRCELVRRDEGTIVGDGLGSCSTMESKYIDRPRDCENTVLKMGQKRALVAAVLNAFGLSDRFTQDVEEAGQDEPAPAPVSRPEPETAPVGPMVLPGPSSSWGGHGGKLLGEVPVSVLTAFIEWTAKEKDRPRKFGREILAATVERNRREVEGDAVDAQPEIGA